MAVTVKAEDKKVAPKKATPKKATTPKKPAPKSAKSAPKGKKGVGKKKKQTLKFVIECKNPVEDGIMKTAPFVSVQASRSHKNRIY